LVVDAEGLTDRGQELRHRDRPAVELGQQKGEG
jgi:hypothetical protein